MPAGPYSVEGRGDGVNPGPQLQTGNNGNLLREQDGGEGESEGGLVAEHVISRPPGDRRCSERQDVVQALERHDPSKSLPT